MTEMETDSKFKKQFFSTLNSTLVSNMLGDIIMQLLSMMKL